MTRYQILWQLLLLLIAVNNLKAQTGPGNQSFVSFTASPECAGSKNGKIRIMIVDNIPP
jgi:hypothetical protein